MKSKADVTEFSDTCKAVQYNLRKKLQEPTLNCVTGSHLRSSLGSHFSSNGMLFIQTSMKLGQLVATMLMSEFQTGQMDTSSSQKCYKSCPNVKPS